MRHAVAFYENGRRPLEIVASGQWYLRNGGRDPALREALLARGRELRWHPAHMRARYEDWVRGLTGDWLVSRQRFFGVPFPVWYPVDADGEPRYGDPLPPAGTRCRSTRRWTAPPGYAAEQRDRPGGFTAERDVLDTWATSSLTPQIAGGWADDPDLFARVFPYDLHPQAHEIIRTWLFTRCCARTPSSDRLPWTRRRDLRLGAGPGPEEDVEVRGQRDHAGRAARALRRGRGALLGGAAPGSAWTPRTTRGSCGWAGGWR